MIDFWLVGAVVIALHAGFSLGYWVRDWRYQVRGFRGFPRDVAQKSDNDPGEHPGRVFSEYDGEVHRRLFRDLDK